MPDTTEDRSQYTIVKITMNGKPKYLPSEYSPKAAVHS